MALVFGAALFSMAMTSSTPASSVSAEPKTINPLTIFSDISASASRGVVNISAKSIASEGSGPHSEEQLREFLERFYPWLKDRSTPRERQSLGSGFIVEKDGYILTNYHVVRHASETVVTLAKGATEVKKEYKAKIVAIDKKIDLALLKIEPEEELFPLKLGSSEKVKVGEWVMAIGNPLGFSGTVTVGVVSATSRDVGDEFYNKFIQTDASINVGNSGGPLLNTDGEVIGINSVIVTTGLSQGNIGLGFAIPIDLVKSIYDDLKVGAPRHGWMGVYIQPMTDRTRRAFDVPFEGGALVSDVQPDSPASQAGIEPRDLIIELDGVKVESARDLPRMVSARRPGERVKLTIFRSGREIELPIVLGSAPESDDELAPIESESQSESSIAPIWGLRAEPVEAELAKRREMKEPKGLLALDVDPDSPMGRAGLVVDDILLRVGETEVNTIDQLKKALEKAKPGSFKPLHVRRGSSSLFLALEAPKE